MPLPVRTVAEDPFRHFPEVPRLHRPSPRQWNEFLKDDGGPVVVTGALEEVPAFSRWTLDYLKRKAGHRPVGLEHSIRAIYRPDMRLHFGQYPRKTRPFSECIDVVQSAGKGPLYQYVSTLSVQPQLPELVGDLQVPAFARDMPFQDYVLFLGAGGTGSQTHYDPTQGLMSVFQGRKSAVLFPPGNLRRLKAAPALFPLCHFSELDWNLLGRLSKENLPTGLRCTVEAGEMLFIPLNWWHFIRNEALTLGITFVFGAPWNSWFRWRQARRPLRGVVERALARSPGLYRWVSRKLSDYAFSRSGPTLPS
jgi:hypothetical protein